MSKIETDCGTVLLGPFHAGLPGAMQVELETDGEIVKRAAIHIGFEHRCFEKHAEGIDFPGLLPYAERLDYYAPVHASVSYAMAIEKLLGIELSERVQHIRILLIELNRISSHLAFFGNISRILNLAVISSDLRGDRGLIQGIFREISGDPHFGGIIRIGGIAVDISEAWLKEIIRLTGYLKSRMQFYLNMLLGNPLFISRTAGVGILRPETAISYGATGPCLRASGFPRDVRKDAPYLTYPYYEFSVPVGHGEMGSTGDAWDRCHAHYAEMIESIRIMEQAAEKIAALPEDKAAPDCAGMSLPQSHIYLKTESARGELGFFVVGNDTPRPSRVKVRAPSFSNLHAADSLLRDIRYSDLFLILGSLDVCMSEVDR